jgi:hypothetical protein
MAVGLLALDGAWGLRGWQWLFLAEGLPAVCLGLAMRRQGWQHFSSPRYVAVAVKTRFD